MPRCIAAPSSTKNSSGERGPEMNHAKLVLWDEGARRCGHGLGAFHTVVGTAAKGNDVT